VGAGNAVDEGDVDAAVVRAAGAVDVDHRRVVDPAPRLRRDRKLGHVAGQDADRRDRVPRRGPPEAVRVGPHLDRAAGDVLPDEVELPVRADRRATEVAGATGGHRGAPRIAAVVGADDVESGAALVPGDVNGLVARARAGRTGTEVRLIDETGG